MKYEMPEAFANPFITDFLDMLLKLAGHDDIEDVFARCMEIWALEFRILMDTENRERLAKRHDALCSRFSAEQRELMMELSAILLWGVTYNVEKGAPADILGSVRTAMSGKARAKRGTVYTPPHIGELMADLLMGGDGEELHNTIRECGCYACIDICVGSGRLPFGHLQMMASHGVDYMQHGLIYGCDLEITGVHMAYVQFCLYRVPACIYLKDSFCTEAEDPWMTPGYYTRYCGSRYVDRMKDVYRPSVERSLKAGRRSSQKRKKGDTQKTRQ